MSWREEFPKTIKSFDTEEKLDLYFYRTLGFVIAKIAQALRLTPDALTVIGAALGLISGRFFYHNDTNRSLAIGCALLIFAGIFDSADGQLARLGRKGTKFGIVLDGICDNIVFATVYIASLLAVLNHSDWDPTLLWAVAIFAGACHSFESSVLDFYNRDFLAFGCGKGGDSGNPSYRELLEEYQGAQGSDRIFLSARLSWVWQQEKVSCRPEEMRAAWKRALAGERSAEFQEVYRSFNRGILKGWQLMGANFHTVMIILFVFLRRFDLYLILIDILLLPFILFLLRAKQARLDAQMMQALRARGIV